MRVTTSEYNHPAPTPTATKTIMSNVRARNAALTLDDFFRSFPMKSEAMRSRVANALARFGF